MTIHYEYEIRSNPSKNRAEAYIYDKMVGVCEYTIDGDTWNIVHTSVDKEYQGQGIARALVEFVMKDALGQGIHLVATCSYAKKILENK